MSLRNDIMTNLILNKHFQNACACVRSKNDNIVELHLRLIGAEKNECYKVSGRNIHHAIAILSKQFSNSVNKKCGCESRKCIGCNHLNTATKTVLFNL